MTPRRLWAIVLAFSWLSSAVWAYQRGYSPSKTVAMAMKQGATFVYPWTGVVWTMVHTLIYTVVAYLIVRDGTPGVVRLALLASFGAWVVQLVRALIARGR